MAEIPIDLVGRLSDWSSVTSPLAPLSGPQLEALAHLGDRVKERPPPGHLTSASLQPPPSSTASAGSEAGEEAARETSLFPAFAKLEGGRSQIDTGQQFLHWVHQVECSLGAEQDQPFLLYQAELERQLSVTAQLQGEVGASLALLDSLGGQYEEVSRRTTSLHEACQHLLQEQQQLASLDRELQDRLAVFQAADKVAHRLLSPTLSLHSDTFLPLLTTIDTNMARLALHPDYREAAAHLTKFRACLSRALEMVRAHVRRVLEGATAAAREGGGGDSQPLAPSHTAFTLFYGKFRAAAPRIRPIILDMEARQGEEYRGLLGDLEQHYLECRVQLLGPSVRSAVQQLLTVHTRDHTGLVRAGCAFLLHVCEDEFQLHSQFFSGGEASGGEAREELGVALETLCLVLYDSLRPLIIHVTHLETLAELTAILRNEVIGQHCASHPQLTAFRRVAGQMLQDVQERLVYRTSVYIRSDILGYKPAPGDLAYPEKLEMMEAIAEELAAKEDQRRGHSRQNSNSSIVSATSMEVGALTGKTYSGTSPADMHGMWYPPVRRALLTLSKLYRCLEKSIFTGLSQEVLSACLESVASAATAISSSKGKQPSDGRLFEIKHLLILREQIAPFQTEFKVKETSLDFGKIASAARNMFSHRADLLSLSSNNALLEFLLDSSPGVQEHLRDSRKDVDRRLKAVCELFISATSGTVLQPVTDLNLQLAAFLQTRTDRTVRAAAQPWADPGKVQTAVTETLRRVKAAVPAVQRKMQLYLANRETEFILFRPVRSDILTAFVSLLSVLRAEYSLEEQGMVGCPSQEQLAAILASVMVVGVGGRSVRGSLSREMSVSPEGESQARERKRSVKFRGQVESIEEAVSLGEASPLPSGSETVSNGSETVFNGSETVSNVNETVSNSNESFSNGNETVSNGNGGVGVVED